MSLTVNTLDPDVFTVAGVLTPAECRDLIARGEMLGFEAASVTTSAGPKMMPNVRNNDRVVFDDPALADALWARVRALVPEPIDGAMAAGLNPRFRVGASRS